MELFPLFGFIEIKNILIIIHLLGVALGLGGALVADTMFIKTMSDGTISREEFSFLRLGSGIVWTGLLLLVLSGAGMFFLNPDQYAQSSKFLTKMSVVGILSLNAIVFHARHIPIMKKQIGKRFAKSKKFMTNSSSLLVSGVISVVSWVSALVLATFSSIPYPFTVLFCVYLAILAFSLVVGFIIKDYFIPKD